MFRRAISVLLVVISGILHATSVCAADKVRFRDVTAASGIDFVHTDGSSGNYFIIETVASGLATFDYDNDGLIDIYFLNGSALPGMTVNKPPTNRLYKNLGHFRFLDVTEKAGVGDTGYGLAVATADFDNDGDQDIYISNWGPNVFYRNNGDGTFLDITQITRTAAAFPDKAGPALLSSMPTATAGSTCSCPITCDSLRTWMCGRTGKAFASTRIPRDLPSFRICSFTTITMGRSPTSVSSPV